MSPNHCLPCLVLLYFRKTISQGTSTLYSLSLKLPLKPLENQYKQGTSIGQSH